MKNDARSHQKWENRATGVPKSEPKGTKSEPKGSQRQVNGSQNSTKMQPNGAQRVPKVDHWKMLRKRDAFPAICRTILGAIFHEKCIQKSMQKSMTKKYGNVPENASKMMPKRRPKSMTNLWNFGTCDFLVLAKKEPFGPANPRLAATNRATRIVVTRSWTRG